VYLGLILGDGVMGPVLDVEVHGSEAENGVDQAEKVLSLDRDQQRSQSITIGITGQITLFYYRIICRRLCAKS
jgi:hypothetical protein